MLNWSGGGTRPSTQGIWRPSARYSRRTPSGTSPGAACCLEPKQGRDAVLAYFGELGARTQGHFQANVEDIVGGEKHTVAIQQTHGEANGKTLDMATVITFVVRDGQIAEGREFFEDTAKADEFWT